jgi:hypothetical protein
VHHDFRTRPGSLYIQSERFRKFYDISENGAKVYYVFSILESQIGVQGALPQVYSRASISTRSFSRCAARGVVGDSLPVNLCAAELTSLSTRPGAETHKHP